MTVAPVGAVKGFVDEMVTEFGVPLMYLTMTLESSMRACLKSGEMGPAGI